MKPALTCIHLPVAYWMCHGLSDANAGSWVGVHSGSHRRVDRRTPAPGRCHRAHSGGWKWRCQQRAAPWRRRHCQTHPPYGVSPRHKIWEEQNTGRQTLLTERILEIQPRFEKATKRKKNRTDGEMLYFNWTFFLTDNTVPMFGHSICLQYRPHCSHPGDEMQRSHSGGKKSRV